MKFQQKESKLGGQGIPRWIRESKQIIIAIIIFIIIIVIVLSVVLTESLTIDMPDVDYYNFDCSSESVKIHTKVKLIEVTGQEILNKGGLQNDVDNMNLVIEYITLKTGQTCFVRYHFNRPLNGSWTSGTSSTIIKEKNIKYLTIQPDTSPPYSPYSYGYYNPYYGQSYYQYGARPWLWNWGSYGGHRGGHRGGHYGGHRGGHHSGHHGGH